ncbi:hypothetical protein CTZ29_13705 [Bacillus halotolerans]|nr:hypothetical protein CTZ29_13705 [Bacillus halotolerans]
MYHKRAGEITEKRGVSRIHIVLAWLLQKEPVTAPIIGATKMSHLQDAVGALAVKLTPAEVKFLEEPYVPHRIVGHHELCSKTILLEINKILCFGLRERIEGL